MPDEMEQIEARLAAYVDGTLPPAQRAEIEAYLAANPTHGKLISELQSIKSAVGSLPREKAPAEVLDTLQSHMERHALLDGVEDAAATMRVNHWPQLGAVAAVLLLAAGLGLLIYQVLPKPKSGLAILSASSLPTEVDLNARDDVALEKEKSWDGKASDSVKDLRVAEVPLIGSAGKPSTPATPAFGGGGGGNPGVNRDRDADLGGVVAGTTPPAADTQAKALARNQAQSLSTYNNFYANNGPAENAMQSPQQNSINNTFSTNGATANFGVMRQLANTTRVRVVVVTTDDPTITQNLLAGYFAQKQTPIERASDPAVVPGAQPLQFKAGEASTQPAGGNGGGFGGNPSGQGENDLTQAAFADLPAGGRPIVVRGLSSAQIDEAEAFINRQRPARQSARSYWQPAAKVSETSQQLVKVESSSQPLLTGTTSAELAARSLTTAPSTAPSTTSPAVKSRSDAFFARDAATQPSPDLAKATSQTADAPAADLLVVVVPVPATQPATTAPSTRPLATP